MIVSLSTSEEPVASNVTVAPSATDCADPASQTGASSTALTARVAVYEEAEFPVPSFSVYVNVPYVAPFALVAGNHFSLARLDAVIVSPLATTASPLSIEPLESASTHS